MGKTATRARYSAGVADDRDTVRAAQRLRNEVFGLDRPNGIDVDPYDEFCDHIVVRETDGGEVVGTYRLLPPGRTDRLYSEGEFDLGALAGVRADLVEAGRSCVHPAHRSGAVITLLWGALARYTLLSGHRWLAGCASVPLADGPDAATAAWARAESRHLSPPELRVRPNRPWTPPGPPSSHPPLPPLLQGYLSRPRRARRSAPRRRSRRCPRPGRPSGRSRRSARCCTATPPGCSRPSTCG